MVNHSFIIKLLVQFIVFIIVLFLPAHSAVAASTDPESSAIPPTEKSVIPPKDPPLEPSPPSSPAERTNKESSTETQKSLTDSVISKLEQQLADATDRLDQMVRDARFLVDPRKPNSVFHSFYQKFNSGVNSIIVMFDSTNVFDYWQPIEAFLLEFPEVKITAEGQSAFPNLKRWALFDASISFVLTTIAPIFSELSTAIFAPKKIANSEQDQEVSITTSLSYSTATFFVVITNNIGLIASWLNFAPFNNIMYLVQTSVMVAMLLAYREALSQLFVLREYKRGNSEAFSGAGYPRFYVYGIHLGFSVYGLMRRIDTFKFIPTRDAIINASFDAPNFSIDTKIAGRKCILIDQSSIFFHFVLFCAIMCSAAKLQLVIELAIITMYGTIINLKIGLETVVVVKLQLSTS
jgi:hypothetical protein